jgi:hypothetical protein
MWTHRFFALALMAFQMVSVDAEEIQSRAGLRRLVCAPGDIVVNVAAVNPQVIGYDSAVTSVTIPATSLITQNNAAGCDYSNCVLGTVAACGTAYASGSMTLTNSNPWPIVLDTTNAAGVSVSACVRCDTAFPETVDFPSFTYTLVNSLKQKSGALITLTEGFDAVTNTLKNPTDLIENTDTVNYPTTGCIL